MPSVFFLADIQDVPPLRRDGYDDRAAHVSHQSLHHHVLNMVKRGASSLLLPLGSQGSNRCV